MRHLCLACADAEETARPSRERRLNHAAVIMAIGAIIVLLSVFADVLRFGQAGGFGWKQSFGILVAGVVSLCALLMRVPTLLVVGLIAGGLSMIADHIEYGKGPGFGSNQTIGVVIGLGVLFLGLLLLRRSARP